jgi:hypothetical protein
LVDRKRREVLASCRLPSQALEVELNLGSETRKLLGCTYALPDLTTQLATAIRYAVPREVGIEQVTQCAERAQLLQKHIAQHLADGKGLELLV